MKHIEVFEDERATMYDQFIQNWIINYQFIIDTIPLVLALEQANAKELLVVGCGTGNELISLAKHNTSWNITGVDPSPEMINIASNKLEKHPQVRLIHGDIEHEDLKENYDTITLCFVLHFMKDDGTKESLLRNISNRMKPGATFVLLDIFGSEKEFELNIQLLEKLLPVEMNGVLTSERIASMPERIYPISEERLSELAKQLGFSKPIRFFQSAIYGGWVFKKT